MVLKTCRAVMMERSELRVGKLLRDMRDTGEMDVMVILEALPPGRPYRLRRGAMEPNSNCPGEQGKSR